MGKEIEFTSYQSAIFSNLIPSQLLGSHPPLYGSVEDVKKQVLKLLEAGKDGGYVFAPAHAVEWDVPLENMLAFIEVLHSQCGYKRQK